jgi:ATP-dependent DNA ligase
VAVGTVVQPPIAPMLAKLTEAIPEGPGYLFEPKWDGFRCIVFFDGENVYLQSRDLKPLGRYFPELEERLREVLPRPLVLDGEVVIMGPNGLDFDSLQLRIHPAESRVRKLAAETPSAFVAFDLLADGDEDVRALPFDERRKRLEAAFEGIAPPAFLTPATLDREVALDWFDRFEGAGFDGVIAKPLAGAYQPGKRAMAKIKHLRTVDCVIAGFRWAKDETDEAIGSLLLGLYDDAGVLHYLGHTSSFKGAERREWAQRLQALVTEDESVGFGGGRSPGGQSRWSSGKDTSWVRLRPELVCEVTFDYLQGERFRHAATFRRERHDKPLRECTFDQLVATVPYELMSVFDKA